MEFTDIFKSFFSGWKFDPKSAIVTLLLSPVIIALILKTRKFVIKWLDYTLEAIFFYGAKTIKHAVAEKFALKKYCRLCLNDDNKYLHVPSSLETKLEVDKVFVPLTLEHQGGDKVAYSHDDLTTIGNRIRIIGDPGSGKSSLVKKMYRESCFLGTYLPSKASLPIIVELKTLEIPKNIKDNKLGDWFYANLKSRLEKIDVFNMGDCFESYVQTKGILLLLDGLDEVSSQQYVRIELAIKNISKLLSLKSENNIIILTMRTQFHQQVKASYREHFGPAIFLKPFSPSDIYRFLTRWPFKYNINANIARIYKELTDRPSLREMCSNPLVLSMYISEDQAAGHIIAPESRTEFYKKVVDELLIKRRLKQTGPTHAHSKLKEQREKILGRLAFKHILDAAQPANSLLWSDAIQVVQEVMGCNESDATAIFRELSKETGLVTEERFEQTFRFIHLTFCEFLAAQECIQGHVDGWQKLVKAHSQFAASREYNIRSRLVEVIPFACGLMTRVLRSKAIDDVVRLDNPDIITRSFLETKEYNHHSWGGFISRQQQNLLNVSEGQLDEKWLRDLHLFNVVLRDCHLCSSHMPVEYIINMEVFFKKLLERQNDNLNALIAAYAEQDAAAAFRLAEVSNLDLASMFPEIIITNSAQEPFFALLIEQALSEPARLELWAAIISESALRHQIVAKWLYEMKPIESITENVDSIKNKPSLMFKVIKNNAYWQIMTIALNSSNYNIDNFPALNILNANKLSFKTNIKYLIYKFTPLILLSLALFIYYITKSFNISLLVSVILILPLIMMCACKLDADTKFIRDLLNLKEPLDPFSTIFDDPNVFDKSCLHFFKSIENISSRLVDAMMNSHQKTILNDLSKYRKVDSNAY